MRVSIHLQKLLSLRSGQPMIKIVGQLADQFRVFRRQVVVLAKIVGEVVQLPRLVGIGTDELPGTTTHGAELAELPEQLRCGAAPPESTGAMSMPSSTRSVGAALPAATTNVGSKSMLSTGGKCKPCRPECVRASGPRPVCGSPLRNTSHIRPAAARCWPRWRRSWG